MKLTKVFSAVAAVVLSVMYSPSANALSFGDEYYVGQIVNGAPASAADEVSYINWLTTLLPGAAAIQLPGGGDGEYYNRGGSTLTSVFDTAVVLDNSNGLDPALAIEVDGEEYILAKYGGFSFVWYNPDGFEGSQTIPQTGSVFGETKTTGLSHISLYNPTDEHTPPVPDGGTTLALLGGAMVAVGALQRRLVK